MYSLFNVIVNQLSFLQLQCNTFPCHPYFNFRISNSGGTNEQATEYCNSIVLVLVVLLAAGCAARESVAPMPAPVTAPKPLPAPAPPVRDATGTAEFQGSEASTNLPGTDRKIIRTGRSRLKLPISEKP